MADSGLNSSSEDYSELVDCFEDLGIEESIDSYYWYFQAILLGMAHPQ